MFSGVTEGMGRVVAFKDVDRQGRAPLRRMTLLVPAALTKSLKLGGSVAVNGVCLSVVKRAGRRLSFDAITETLRRTSLGTLRQGDFVNLERPLRYGARMEGHYVLGHVDARGRIRRVARSRLQASFEISFPPKLRRFFLEKGSVAVDGISLTIGKVGRNSFWVHCIPVTLKKSTFGRRRKGDLVNLEADYLLKASGRRNPSNHLK